MSPEKLTPDQVRTASSNSRAEFSASTSPYAAKIVRILTEFDKFSEQYRTLWNELGGKLPQQPPSDAALDVDERISNLWLALQEIVNQYKLPGYQLKVEEGMKYLENLAKTNPDLFPSVYGVPDALIFIKKREDNIARKYPYTNTFFIGISEFSANLANDPNVEADWRPVAHELGHYLYWNSLFPTATGKKFAQNDRDPIFAEDLSAALENIAGIRASAQSMNEGLKALMTAWSEEIFADLVGTRLLGREYAESAQKLFIDQQNKQDTVRFSIDIEHPIPYLRPFVCAEGLKLVENKRNTFWSGFKTMIENLFNKPDFEASQALSIGLLTIETTIREEGYTPLELDIPTLQKAIKTVVPVIYDKLSNKEALTGRPVGIELIRSKIREDFVNFYINTSDVWEKGDKQGILNTGRSIVKKIIKFFFR